MRGCEQLRSSTEACSRARQAAPRAERAGSQHQPDRQWREARRDGCGSCQGVSLPPWVLASALAPGLSSAAASPLASIQPPEQDHLGAHPWHRASPRGGAPDDVRGGGAGPVVKTPPPPPGSLLLSGGVFPVRHSKGFLEASPPLVWAGFWSSRKGHPRPRFPGEPAQAPRF